MSAALLRVQLLGTFAITYGDQAITSLHAARLQALLAALLLHRAAPQTRQQIAFQFWPDTSDAQAQTNLRQLLYTLRQRLPNASAYLLVDDHTVAWRSDGPCTVDIAVFADALAVAVKANGAAKIQALEAAVAAYTGDLLPGCFDDLDHCAARAVGAAVRGCAGTTRAAP